MKYIDADRLIAEIDKRLMDVNLEELHNMGSHRVWAYNDVKSIIGEMQQEQPTPPGIEKESKKKGWLDYGLMMSEIGLYRYNAIHRIKAHKEEFDPRTIPNLYHVAEYYKAVGEEVVCCCLQRYCMDFRFDQEDVREIISKED